MFREPQAGTFLLGILGSYCPPSFPELMPHPRLLNPWVLASYHLSGSLPEPPAKQQPASLETRPQQAPTLARTSVGRL